MGEINSQAILQARPTIKIGGQESALMAGRLSELLIHENLHGMSRCEASFNNWGASDGGIGYLLFDRSVLDFGKVFEIKLLDTIVFSGKITAMQADYPNGAIPQIRILAEDGLQDLRMTRRTRSFSDLTDTQVIEQIAQGHGLSAQVNLPGPTHKILAQINQTDLGFIRERARATGGEIWLEGQTLHAASRTDRASNTINLAHGAGLREFSVLADLSNQATSMSVSGWDVVGKEVINEMAEDDAIAAELEQDISGSSILKSAFGERKQTHAHNVPATSDEAREMAKAHFREMARRFVVGTGVAEPDPRLRVGIKVQLTGLGPLFSGKYYVTETNLTFDGRRGLCTNFRGERPGLGSV